MTVKRHVLRTLLGIGLAGAVVGAGGIINAQSQAHPSGIRVSVIGCVQRSTPLRPETLDTTIIPAGETKYVLSNITLVPEDGRTGETGNTSSGQLIAQAVKMYRLDDSADSLIAPHVGDRVRVTGTVGATPRSSTGNTGPKESPAIVETGPPTLQVESLQKISSESSTCSQ